MRKKTAQNSWPWQKKCQGKHGLSSSLQDDQEVLVLALYQTNAKSDSHDLLGGTYYVDALVMTLWQISACYPVLFVCYSY